MTRAEWPHKTEAWECEWIRHAVGQRQLAPYTHTTFGNRKNGERQEGKTDWSRCAAGVMGGPWRTIRPAAGRLSGTRRRTQHDQPPRVWSRRRVRRPGELWCRRQADAVVITEEPGINPEQGALPDRRRWYRERRRVSAHVRPRPPTDARPNLVLRTSHARG